MPKLEEILKSKGYTPEDIEALKPLLGNDRYRTSIESILDEFEGDRNKAVATAERWDKWYNEQAIPEIERSTQDAATARAEAAQVRARLQYLQERGLAQLAGEPTPANPNPAAANPAAGAGGASGGPDMAKFATWDQVKELAASEGKAIALVQDIVAEHLALTGKPLKGVQELRDEAIRNGVGLQEWWMRKYDVPALRAAAEAKQKADERAAIEKEVRTQLAAEYGNPAARPPMPSNNYLTQRAREAGANGAPKFPWQNSPNRLMQDRVNRAVTKQESVQ